MSITAMRREVTCSLRASFVLRKQRAFWGFLAPGSVVQIPEGGTPLEDSRPLHRAGKGGKG